jgi:hypothetical protein
MTEDEKPIYIIKKIISKTPKFGDIEIKETHVLPLHTYDAGTGDWFRTSSAVYLKIKSKYHSDVINLENDRVELQKMLENITGYEFSIEYS